MAKSDGTVFINTLLDTTGFGKGVNTMHKQIGGLSGAIGKLGAVITATFAVGKLINFGKEAIDLGSDLSEVQNVVDVTFTTMNEQINEFAKNAAEASGLSETMAKKYAGTFGAMAKAFGFAEGEAFNMSTSLTQLAGDVASFYNLTQDEAYTKLKSVFTGETESLKDLGVVMTQTALDAFALEQGYGKTTKQMTEQEKVALRYAFVIKQLNSASGDFVRTQDSWANQTRILSLNFDTFKANIGQALINIFTPFLKVINQLVAKMAQLSQHFVSFSEMLTGKSISSGGGSPGEALAGIESGYEGIADATDEAAKAQKKYLTGLDEIRTFQAPDTDTSTVSGGGIDILGTTLSEDSSVEQAETIIDRVINKITEMIKNGDWKGIGAYISDGIIFALSFLNDKLSNFDWGGIGEDVGEFLSGIDWAEIIKNALALKMNIWEALAKVWFGTFKAAPFETAIFSGFYLLKFTPLGGILASKIMESIANSKFVSILTTFFANNFSKIFGAGSILAGVTLAVTSFIDMWKNGLDWLNEAFMLLGITIAAIGAILLGAPALVTGIIAAIVAAIATAIVWLKDNWSEVVEFFKGLVNGIILFINALVSGFVTGINVIIGALNKISFDVPDWVLGIGGETIGVNIKEITAPKIPYLATGAVIPPNAPFMAMLGDQKHGTNIEAPLDTIKQAMREVVGNGSGGQYAFTAQINRRTLFEEMIDEAKLRQSTSGRNPFELA